MPSAFGSNYYMKFTLWARGLLSPRFAGSLRPLTTYNHYAPQGPSRHETGDGGARLRLTRGRRERLTTTPRSIIIQFEASPSVKANGGAWAEWRGRENPLRAAPLLPGYKKLSHMYKDSVTCMLSLQLLQVLRIWVLVTVIIHRLIFWILVHMT